MLKLAKNPARAKKDLETELKFIHFPCPSYHPKIVGDILKNIRKTSASVLMRLYD